MLDFEKADELSLHVKSHVPFTKTNATTGCNSKLSIYIRCNSCKVVCKNVPSPYLTTITQLPVTKITLFYDPNIPFHERLN
jgi:hypothetical protein